MDTRWNLGETSSPVIFISLLDTFEWIIKTMYEVRPLCHLLVDDLLSAESQSEK